MELLDERWTMLVVRELVTGSRHFNELCRGSPPDLPRAAVQASPPVQPVIEALGTWGIRWIGDLGDEDLDPQLLLWDMHRNIDGGAVPVGRTVEQFSFPDVPAGSRDWWLLITPDAVDVCDGRCCVAPGAASVVHAVRVRHRSPAELAVRRLIREAVDDRLSDRRPAVSRSRSGDRHARRGAWRRLPAPSGHRRHRVDPVVPRRPNVALSHLVAFRLSCGASHARQMLDRVLRADDEPSFPRVLDPRSMWTLERRNGQDVVRGGGGIGCASA